MVPDRNHGGHRRIVAAIVGLLALSTAGEGAESKLQDTRGDQKQADSKKEQRGGGPATPAPSVEAIEQAEGAEYNPPCAEGQDDRRSDLCAQWKAADSAANAAWWAKWQTYLSAAGIVGLLYSLHLTRTATKTAVDAYRTEHRPWLRINAIIYNDMSLIQDRWQMWGNLQLVNVGKSPAIEVDVKSKFLVFTEEEIEIKLQAAFQKFQRQSLKERNEAKLEGEIVFPEIKSDNPVEWPSNPAGLGSFILQL